MLLAAALIPAHGNAQSRQTPEQALDRAAELAQRKVPREIAQRRARHNLDDWPSDVMMFVRIERRMMPIFDAPGLAGPKWTVLAVAHRGEILQFIKQTQIVQFTNPLGREPDGSGIWYQVRLPDGRDGWLLARPSASEAAPFAVFVRRQVPRDTLPETLGVIIGILFWPLVLTIWFLRSRRKKAAEPPVSVGDSGSDGWTGGEEDRDKERSVNPFFAASKIKDAIFSDAKVLKDSAGHTVGRLEKAVFSHDQIIKDEFGHKAGRIESGDKQTIRDASGDKIGEIKTNFWGERVVVNKDGEQVAKITKNFWGETVIKKK